MKHDYTSILRRTLSAFVFLMLSTLSWADDFEVEGIIYSTNVDGESVTLSRSSNLQAYSGDVVIPSTVVHEGKTYRVTAIGYDAFYCCTELLSVDIPSSVTSIGNDAFYGCYGLTSVDIHEGVTSIGGYAFGRCDSLTTVDIPSSVTSIGSCAFYECHSLTTVVCRAANVPECNSDAFYNDPVNRVTLYVPASSIEAYKAANPWKRFGTILPLEDYETGIDTPASSQESGTGAAPYYTLDGRRVASPVCGGIYIRSGRKVIVR